MGSMRTFFDALLLQAVKKLERGERVDGAAYGACAYGACAHGASAHDACAHGTCAHGACASGLPPCKGSDCMSLPIGAELG